MTKHIPLDHHEIARNIRLVQRQIALANLPHSYRLIDPTNLHQESAGHHLPAANDSGRGDIGK